MSANAAIFNPTETTSAATGDGLSCPRLTTTGRLAITFGLRDKGMMVYDTTLNSLFIWNGSAWELIDGTGTSSNTQVLFNDNGATAGDTTMVFNKVTDTLTVQNLVVTGTTTALGGLDASAIRAAASDYAAVTFDGATASTRISSTLTGQAIGTGDFSIWCRFKVSQKSGGTVFSVFENNSNFFGVVTSSGNYTLDKTIGGVASSATITGFTGAAFAGQIVDFVLVRSAGVFSVYINGSAYTLTNTTGNISLSAVANIRVGGYFIASQVFDKDVYRFVAFNRALSAGDVTDLITLGVNPADQWGTQAQVVGFNPGELNGGFETNSLNVAGTWATAVSGTSTSTIDTSGSFSLTGTNAGKLTLDALGSFASFNASNGSTSLLAIAKRHRISIWARKGAASGACGIQFGPIASGGIYGNSGLVLTTSYSNTLVEVVTSVDGGFSMSRASGSAGLSEIYIDDVEITRIGAIVDLDFTVGTGFQATDRSTNKLNGTLFNGVSWTMPETSARLYATTAFLGNSKLLGTLSIPTNAVIEDIFVFVVGVSTIQIGDVSGGSSIVGSQTAGGYTRLTLAGFLSTTGELWVNSSNSNSITFTIIYSISQP